uniref:Putative ARP2/3 protein complex subunit p41 n=1 Tax=Rhizophora mucronata TaxID=61149 RepID=A0A2P2L0Z2_RHIMU
MRDHYEGYSNSIGIPTNCPCQTMALVLAVIIPCSTSGGWRFIQSPYSTANPCCSPPALLSFLYWTILTCNTIEN